jgi:hypothetical protein
MAQSNGNHARFLYVRVLIDFLKTNGHRIAHHALSRTETPLASRNDIKPLISLVDGHIADILTLDPHSRKTFIKVIYSDELIAHFSGDVALDHSLSSLKSANIDDFHFIFSTSGILTPSLLQTDYTADSSSLKELTFLETRFDSTSIHKIGNPTIYLRKAIGQIRTVDPTFKENTSDICECGNAFFQGKYSIRYWGKERKLEYSICDNCGIQKESGENSSTIMNFLIGLTAE